MKTGVPNHSIRLETEALNSLAVPMKKRDPIKTRVHNCSGEIVVNGKTMLLPDGVAEAKWWLTCDSEYLLIHDGEILARGDATEPFEAFEFYVPRLVRQSSSDAESTEKQVQNSVMNVI